MWLPIQTIQDNHNLLTLSAHTREGYSSHFVTLSVCLSSSVSLFDFGEGAVFQG